ncbi:astacin, partial [Ostertagia ostertagi]
MNSYEKWRPIKTDKVGQNGDSITEVNENSHVDKVLYQGDVVLTEEQAEEIVEDIEDEVAGANRTKRQAFKDHRYPKMLWSQGVNYHFSSMADEKMRRAFVKGAKLWEKDTCINFTKNPFAQDRILVFPEDGCWSYVGKLGGEQKLSLGRGCETTSI